LKLVKQSSLNLSVVAESLKKKFAIFGLPVLLPPRPDPTPLAMSVEILPISAESNVKPSDKPIQKEQHAKAVLKPVPPTPPQKTPEPVKAKEPPPPEKPVDPKEAAPAPDKPKPPEKKPEEDEFKKLLDNMKKEQALKDKALADKTPPKPQAPATTPGKDKTNVEENKTKSDAPYDASKPMSISERDAIRSQFIPCWHAPIGAKDAASLAVRVKVELIESGEVKTAVLAPDQQGRYNSDPYFRAAADSAVRAVFKCSPLKNLPADKFGTWQNMEINFDPKDML